MPSSPNSSVSLSVVRTTQGDLGDAYQLRVYFNICQGEKSNLYFHTDDCLRRFKVDFRKMWRK